MENNTLQFVIKATDEASAALQSVKNATDQLASSADSASKSTENMTEAGKTQTESFSSLTTSIFTAEEAVNVFNEAIEAGKDFLGDSIEEAMKASRTQAQLANDVKNAGLSYKELAPQIEEVANANIKLGFADDDTQQSIGKLILATGSYSQALQLNQLAMDLSRSKNIDLNSATVLVEQVMAGNTRALKQYGISLDSAATSAEALTLLQSKVGGSAQAAAASGGEMGEIMAAQWDKVKQEVGDQLMPEVEKLFSAFQEALPEIESLLKNTVEIIAELVDMVMTYVKHVTEAVNTIKDAYHGLIGDTQAVAQSNVQLSKGIEGVIEKYNELHPKAKLTDDSFKNLDFTAQKAIITEVSHANALNGTKEAVDKAGTSFEGVANHIKSADAAMVKHSDAIAKLGTEYNKLSDNAQSDIDNLTDAFTTKMTSINDSIKKTQQSIQDLQTSYAQQTGDQTATVADQIVASEKKVADLKTQLAASTSASTTATLTKQLADEQKNLDSSKDFQTKHAAEMTAAEKRGTETALQLSIESFDQTQARETAAYTQKMTDLQQTLSQEQASAATEVAMYTQKMASIKTLLTTAQTEFIAQSQQRQDQTTKEVDAEIAKYTALAAAISAVNSAKSSGGISTAVAASHRATGGTVNAGQPYMIGEQGAEMFVPDSAGSIVPNHQLSSGGAPNINITVTGTFMSSDAAEKMGDMILGRLKRVSRISVQ